MIMATVIRMKIIFMIIIMLIIIIFFGSVLLQLDLDVLYLKPATLLNSLCQILLLIMISLTSFILIIMIMFNY